MPIIWLSKYSVGLVDGPVKNSLTCHCPNKFFHYSLEYLDTYLIEGGELPQLGATLKCILSYEDRIVGCRRRDDSFDGLAR